MSFTQQDTKPKLRWEIPMKKKKVSSREKEKHLKSQQPMNTYYDWLWYCPARLQEHPIHAKRLKSEKKPRKFKKKVRPK
jgi:hypothetical protein